MADIAAKQFRAEQLRQRLSVLRVQHTADAQEADQVALDAKLDEEIALLEKQVAIEEQRKESGGSVIDAMEVMAEAARLEDEKTASLEAASDSAVIVAPVADGESETTSTEEPVEPGTEVSSESLDEEANVAPGPIVTPVSGLGLTPPAAPTGGNQ